MPYILQSRRLLLDAALHPVLQGSIQGGTVGDLTYAITRVVLAWLGSSPDFSRLSQAVGALECAKIELYRREIAPYEDEKCEANGDVY